MFERRPLAPRAAASEPTSRDDAPILIGAVIAVVGLVLLARSDVRSQGDWNVRYGKR